MTENQITIKNLELKVKQVLEEKKKARPRRPIVIEFCGTPKAGKTSCVSSLNLFLKRNGFKTKVLTERASVCPIHDKYNPAFNLWNLFSSGAELLENFIEKASDIDVILCDRSVFDSLCWFKWFKKYDHLNDEDYRRTVDFLTMNRYKAMFDLIYVFKATPKIALDREYKNLLTRHPGTIMNKKVLKEYNDSLDESMNDYKHTFRCIRNLDTGELSQNEVSLQVTVDVLESLYEILVEKVGFVQRAELSEYENKNYWKDDNFLSKLNVKFNFRDIVEQTNEYVQPLPVLVLVDKKQEKILIAKKKKAALGEKSPEKDKFLAYFGGHIRDEDKIAGDNNESLIFNALGREIKEELNITLNVASKVSSPFYIWLKDNPRSEKHLAICYIYKADFDHHKIKLDDYEFIQKTGRSKSGRVYDIDKLDSSEFEKWSQIILQENFNKKYDKNLFE